MTFVVIRRGGIKQKTANSLRISGLLWCHQKLNIVFDSSILADDSGIGNIAADNSNAPVEYFTLQGIRVDSPVSGTIVIRRQGTEVSKIIMR